MVRHPDSWDRSKDIPLIKLDKPYSHVPVLVLTSFSVYVRACDSHIKTLKHPADDREPDNALEIGPDLIGRIRD